MITNIGMSSHAYPGLSPQEAKEKLNSYPEDGMPSTKFTRTAPQIAQGEPFIYTEELHKRLLLLAEKLADCINENITDGQSKDDANFKAQCELSLSWYEALKDVPVSVVEDDNFWRYLTVAVLGSKEPVRDFLKGKDIHIGTMSSNLKEDGSTSRSSDILAKRMYVRGRLLRSPNLTSSGGDPTSQEFESSHVYPGSLNDARPTWQKAMYGAYTGSGKQNMDKNRSAATKVNAARSARVATATSEDRANKLASDLKPK